MTITMTEAEYREGTNEMNGVCLACGEITYGGTEPDARKYKCDGCGAHAVMGFEMALVAGHIDFKEESLEWTEALEGGLS